MDFGESFGVLQLGGAMGAGKLKSWRAGAQGSRGPGFGEGYNL